MVLHILLRPSPFFSVLHMLLLFRHHTCFLPEDPNFRNANGNPLPGMVVDNTIVSNFYYDFYLSAHYGALGEFQFTD